MLQQIYQYLWFFFLYAFFGWCAEVVFAAAGKGRFVNRGFLNGPLCPIYGCGVSLVVAILSPVKENLPLLYLGSVILTSLVELVTGFLMERLFHHRWWDYSKMPCNIGGYVCLLFSLIWGLACVLVVDVIHPLVANLVAFIPHTLGAVLLWAFTGTFLADIVITVACVCKLNAHLQQIDEAQKALRKLSDNIGGNLAERAISLRQKSEAKLKDLKAHKPNYVERRLLEAFPNMRSQSYREALESFRERVKEWKEGHGEKKSQN